MRENCTSGIAPGAPGNRRSYGGGSNNRIEKRRRKKCRSAREPWRGRQSFPRNGVGGSLPETPGRLGNRLFARWCGAAKSSAALLGAGQLLESYHGATVTVHGARLAIRAEDLADWLRNDAPIALRRHHLGINSGPGFSDLRKAKRIEFWGVE